MYCLLSVEISMHWYMDCMKMADIRRNMKTKTRGCIIVYVIYTYDGFVDGNSVALCEMNNVKNDIGPFYQCHCNWN